MSIKYTVLFVPDKEKDKPDGRLRCRIRWEGITLAVNIGYRVSLDKWSYDAQCCKNNTTHGKKKIAASIINRDINLYRDVIDEAFAFFDRQKAIPTSQELKEFLNEKLGKQVQKKVDVVSCLDEYIRYLSRLNDWTEGTMKYYQVLRYHFTLYEQKDLSVFDSEQGMNDYLVFMQTHLKLRNSTIARRLRQIKSFLSWCVKQGYLLGKYDYANFKPMLKQTQKKIVYLTWEELMKLYNYRIPQDGVEVYLTNEKGESYTKVVKYSETLNKVRDVFCFMCFTSLRYSDVCILKRSNVYDTYIEITSKKTIDALKIELNRYSKAILDKYQGNIYPYNRALPVMSNPKTNLYIKDVCELVGIDTPITETYYRNGVRVDETKPKYKCISVHAGRRTFISNALMLGISPQIVMKWTGHCDYKAMQPYIAIADSVKQKAMSMFDSVPDFEKQGLK